MTPEEQSTIDQKLRERRFGSPHLVAEILYHNTSSEELSTFETIELSVREHLLGKVAPKIGEFFSIKQEEIEQEGSET